MKEQNIEQMNKAGEYLRKMLIGYSVAILLLLLQITPCIASINAQYDTLAIYFVLDTPVISLDCYEQFELNDQRREYPTIIRPDNSCTEIYKVVVVSENGRYIGKLCEWAPEGNIYSGDIRYLLIQNQQGDTIVEMNPHFPVERILIANNGRFVLHSIRYPWDDLRDPEIVISIFDATGTMVRQIKEGYGSQRGFAYSEDGNLLFALLRKGRIVILKCFSDNGHVLWAKQIDNISLTNTLEGLRYDSATKTIVVRASERGYSGGVKYVFNEQGDVISKDTYATFTRH